MNIKIKYHDKEIPFIEKLDKGDWIDLYTAEDIDVKQGDFKLVSLGVSMKLPAGYEANIVARSSTFKNYGIIQTNCFGVIDESYCGENDVWKFPLYATRDVFIPKHTRIAQFRINKKMEPITFIPVDHMEDGDRGGFGSTGK